MAATSKKILLLHISIIQIFLTITAPLWKAQAITSRLLQFFSKYFLHCQLNEYVRVAIYTYSLIVM